MVPPFLLFLCSCCCSTSINNEVNIFKFWTYPNSKSIMEPIAITSDYQLPEPIDNDSEKDYQFLMFPPALLVLNPVVLDCIFSKLDFSCLKSARLVCKIWERVAVVSLSKRSIIYLSKVLPCCQPATFIPTLTALTMPNSSSPSTSPTILSLNPLLVKNVQMIDQCKCPEVRRTYEVTARDYVTDPYYGSPKNNASPGNFFKFLSIYQDQLVSISIWDSRELAEALLKALSIYKFPNLAQLTLSVCEYTHEKERKLIETKQDPMQIGTKGGLKRLQLLYARRNIDKEGYVLRMNTFQSIINASPNLECLKISGNFYPEMNRNGKSILKELSHTTTHRMQILSEGSPHTVQDDTVDFKKLGRLLTQVGDSLVKLNLEDWPFREEYYLPWITERLQFPAMPQLTHLTLRTSPEYKFLGGIINTKRLPRLKFLSLKTQRPYSGMADFIRRIPDIHDKVQMLQLHEVEGMAAFHPAIAKIVTKNFPNVEIFHLEYQLNQSVRDGEEFNYLIESIQKLKGWKTLKKIDVIIYSIRAVEDARDILKNLADLQGCKIVILRCQSWWYPPNCIIFDFCEAMKGFLLLCKEMDSIRIYNLVVTTSDFQNIREFILQNKISVEFKRPFLLENDKILEFRSSTNIGLGLIGTVDYPDLDFEFEEGLQNQQSSKHAFNLKL